MTDANGAPFDSEFFRRVVPERVKTLQLAHPRRVMTVLVQLADECTLDICRIEQLTPRWIAVAAYRDRRTCAEMDIVFFPYEAIAHVSISPEDPGAQPLGFQFEKPAVAAGMSEARAGPCASAVERAPQSAP